MRHYVRYIILLILIIAFGLLCISIFNKVTEPDISKVNNKNKVEEKDDVVTKEKDKEKEEIGGPTVTPTPTPTPSAPIENYPVPNTATGDSNSEEVPSENIPIYSDYNGNLIIIE